MPPAQDEGGTGSAAGGTGPDGPWWRTDDDSPRVLGFSRNRLPSLVQVPVLPLRHPVKWVRWRRCVRRLGPYAPHFDGYLREGPPDRPPPPDRPAPPGR